MGTVARPQFWVILLTIFCALGCSGSGKGDEQSARGNLELWTWWAEVGEQRALASLLGQYSAAYPNVTILNVTKEGSDQLRDDLQLRLVAGNPPDVFQAPPGRSLNQWTSPQLVLEPLDWLYAQEGWYSAFPQYLRDTLSYKSAIYAVPVGIHRLNLMFYNIRLLKEHGIDQPPSTMDEWYAVADTLQAANVYPLALGSTADWPVTLLFWENLLLVKAGPDFYTQFFSGKLNPDAVGSDPNLRATFDETKKLLAYANPNHRQLDWNEAADLLVSGTAAFTVMGDWTRAHFRASANWQPDVDFGVVPMPGTQDVYVFDVDCFAQPRGALHPDDVVGFLKVAGSEAGQSAFGPLKGAVPARPISDTSMFDSQTKSTMNDFQTKRLLGSVPELAGPDLESELDSIMGEFADKLDIDLAMGRVALAYKSWLLSSP
jgi:glucose/mannose transport system substrate-binding protein